MATKNILIFYTTSKRSVQFNTLFKIYVEAGHRVYLLTTSSWGPLHEDAKRLGVVQAVGLNDDINTSKGKLMILISLIRYCYRFKIDTVISHLQPANLIAVLAQYFTKAKFIIFRHHFNFSYFTRQPFGVNANESKADKMINALANKIVVPSTGVYKGMTEIEKVPADKLAIVPYIYDFQDYPVPDEQEVAKIKTQFPAPLLLLMCSRMVPLKRHALVIEIMHQLVQEDYDIQLLLVDEGPEKERLQEMVAAYKLGNNIRFLGFRKDLVNYMAAADLLVHPSLTEASNSTVKEMGLVKRTAIVCKGVGDFDEYLDHTNSFRVDIDQPEAEITSILRTVYQDKDQLTEKGNNLYQTVINRFSTNQQVVEQYLKNI